MSVDAWFARHLNGIESVLSLAMKSAIEDRTSAPLVHMAKTMLEHAAQHQEADAAEQIAALRVMLQTIALAEARIAERLTALLPAAAASSRAGYLRMLPDIIGEKPRQSWENEWAAMLLELKQTNGELARRDDGAWIANRDFQWGTGSVVAGEVVDTAWIERHESVKS